MLVHTRLLLEEVTSNKHEVKKIYIVFFNYVVDCLICTKLDYIALIVPQKYKLSMYYHAKFIVQMHNLALLKSCEVVTLRYFAKTKLLMQIISFC